MQKPCEIVNFCIHFSNLSKSIGDWNSMKVIFIKGLVHDDYNNNNNNNNNNNKNNYNNSSNNNTNDNDNGNNNNNDNSNWYLIYINLILFYIFCGIV